MPLEGSLRELNIAEIIQFPAASRRTGRLVLRRDDAEACLYYRLGELHHATLGTLAGFPVLVEILPWRRGAFRFEVDVAAPTQSIDMDLGRALMQATLQSEEREGAEADEEAHASPLHARSVQSTVGFHSYLGSTWDPAIFARLSTFVSEHPVFFYACVMNRRGRVRAEFIRAVDNLQGTAETYGLLRDIMKNYALCCEQRMVVDSSHCTVAIQPFSEDQVILALASPEEDKARTEAAIASLVQNLEDPYAV